MYTLGCAHRPHHGRGEACARTPPRARMRSLRNLHCILVPRQGTSLGNSMAKWGDSHSRGMDVHASALCLFPWDVLGVSALVTDADLTQGQREEQPGREEKKPRVEAAPVGAPGSAQTREAEGRGSVSPFVLLPFTLTRNVPLTVTHQPACAHGGSPCLPRTPRLSSIP